MKVLVTGADGFIGRNLLAHLREGGEHDVRVLTRESSAGELAQLMGKVEVVFHLAGVNRPEDPAEFETGNAWLTEQLCDAIRRAGTPRGHRPVVVYASSTQADLDNPYGRSKRAGETALLSAAGSGVLAARIFRLPNVFGKWARPNYNSAVATFCYNVSRGLPIEIHDPAARLKLVYVDDVVASFRRILEGDDSGDAFCDVSPVYETTVGDVAALVREFATSRVSLVTERVGTGFLRALYATYVSYLPKDSFSYEVPQHADARGTFVEMLKTTDSGQFSFFTALPGVTRGGHYHHTKTEKFLVIRGNARFRFRNILSGETHELLADGRSPTIVETVPGWTHDVSNVGSDELVVMLWANEVFDRRRPDTYVCPV